MPSPRRHVRITLKSGYAGEADAFVIGLPGRSFVLAKIALFKICEPPLQSFLERDGIGRSPGTSHPQHTSHGAHNVPAISSPHRYNRAVACLPVICPRGPSRCGHAQAHNQNRRRHADPWRLLESAIRRRRRAFFPRCGSVRLRACVHNACMSQPRGLKALTTRCAERTSTSHDHRLCRGVQKCIRHHFATS
jgi:hypothetical protein